MYPDKKNAEKALDRKISVSERHFTFMVKTRLPLTGYLSGVQKPKIHRKFFFFGQIRQQQSNPSNRQFNNHEFCFFWRKNFVVKPFVFLCGWQSFWIEEFSRSSVGETRGKFKKMLHFSQIDHILFFWKFWLKSYNRLFYTFIVLRSSVIYLQ